MPKALACCSLCDHLGLLVRNTTVPTSSKTLFAEYESLNLLFALAHLFRICKARVLLSYHTAKFGHEVGPLESRRMRPLTTVFFPFISDVLDFVIFQGFLVCVHYMLETVRRPFPSCSVSSSLKSWSVAVACSPNAGSMCYAISSRYNSALHKRRRLMSARRRIQNAA